MSNKEGDSPGRPVGEPPGDGPHPPGEPAQHRDAHLVRVDRLGRAVVVANPAVHPEVDPDPYVDEGAWAEDQCYGDLPRARSFAIREFGKLSVPTATPEE